MKVRIADDSIIKSGVDKTTTESSARSFLEGCRYPTTPWPITFYPPYWKSSSDDKKVKLIDPFKVTMVSMEKYPSGRRFEWEADLTMEVVTLS